MNNYGSQIIRSRAPVRVDFAGGWTDVAEFARITPGAVVNTTLNLWTYATVTSDPDITGVNISSGDFEEYVTAKDIKELEYDGQVDLVKAAIRILNVKAGLSIQTRSDAPAGSGLGTSAAMGVALIGGIGCLMERPLLNFEIAELASTIEQQELGIKGGKQDHYASALGGMNFMEFFGEKVRTAPIPLSNATQMCLEKHLILVYVGKSRLSGDIHSNVWSAYRAGNPDTVNAVEEMKRLAHLTKDALLTGDVRKVSELIGENWRCQKALHPSVTNEELDNLFELAAKSGACGWKACGAGGGGCVLLMAEPEQEHKLRRAIESLPKAAILPVIFESNGIQVARFDRL